MSDATCRTCPWMFKLDSYGSYPEAGECRFHAPTRDEDPQYFGQRTWPLILFTDQDWCGEHPDRRQP